MPLSPMLAVGVFGLSIGDKAVEKISGKVISLLLLINILRLFTFPEIIFGKIPNERLSGGLGIIF
jgi:hypothetical protein